MARILLVDDELSIIDFVSYNLQKLGHSVEVARDGSEALSNLKSTNPDLLILDIMLPGIDGYEVLKRVRETSDLPVLMLSSLDTTTDIVLGLELGADDYMTKPFSVRELQARVKALLRRSDPAPRDRLFTHGALVLDVNARTCLWDGSEMDLTQKEFDLLYYLMLNRGLALTRARILDAVWGYDSAAADRTVDTHVKTLRAKLREAGADNPIETLRGVGYRFTAEEPD
jgi:DNA-binding response OmpR family regulator